MLRGRQRTDVRRSPAEADRWHRCCAKIQLVPERVGAAPLEACVLTIPSFPKAVSRRISLEPRPARPQVKPEIKNRSRCDGSV